MQIISAIIGSSLFGIVISTLVADYNKPAADISLYVESDKDRNSSLYSIVARNVGRSAANDFRLSIFLPGSIIWDTISVHGENITLDVVKNFTYNGLLRQYEPSVLIANTSRFATNSLIVIDVITSPKGLTTLFTYPVYIAATYDEGGKEAYYPGSTPTPLIHLPTENRRPLLSPNTQTLIIVSLMSAISFSITFKEIKDKRNLARSVTGIEEEIREIRRILESCKDSSEKIAINFWIHDSSRQKHRIIRNSKDYEAIEQFYNALNNRNSATTTTADQSTIRRYNNDCLKRANSALETIDWSKYYGRLGSDISVDLFLVFLLSIPAAIVIFYVFENMPLGFLLPEVFIRPADITMPAPLDQLHTDSEGRVWFHALVIKYALLFTFISFMLRGFIAFFIAREIIRRIYSTVEWDITSHEKLSTATVASGNRYGSKLLGLSFLIMGFPLWVTLSLFFSDSVYDTLHDEFGVNLLYIAVGLEIVRMSILIVLVPELIRRGKISLPGKHIAVVKERAMMYLLGAIMILAGTFNVILFGTFMQKVLRVSILFETGLFTTVGHVPSSSLIIFGGFVSLGLAQIIFGILGLQKSRKLVAYSSIAMAAIVIIFWLFAIATLTQSRPDLIEIGQGDPLLLPAQRSYPYTLPISDRYYDDIFVSGIMIVSSMLICIVINILSRKQAVSNKNPRRC